MLREFTAALISRAMSAELAHHLGYERGEEPLERQTNRRNGTDSKTLRSEHGEIEVQIPRDRECSFEPQAVPKHLRHFNGFDDKIVSMYARGMTVREIREHLEEIYGVDVSADLVSHVTDAVVDELRTWQQRPLEELYVIVYLDALVVKIRDKGVVQNKSVYLAIGVTLDSRKRVLGMELLTPSSVSIQRGEPCFRGHLELFAVRYGRARRDGFRDAGRGRSLTRFTPSTGRGNRTPQNPR